MHQSQPEEIYKIHVFFFIYSIYSFFLFTPSIDTKKSFGFDKVHPLLLSSAALEIFRPLTYIINLTLKQGIFPDSLKIAKVIPIFKQGSRSSCNNHRPISVLSALSKIFERCILNQLTFYFTTQNILVQSNQLWKDYN